MQQPIDSNPTEAVDILDTPNTLGSLRLAPLGTEAKAGGSKEELKSPPRNTESLIGSPSLPFISNTISTSQASDHNETSKGFESSSAPASIVSSSAIPIDNVTSSTPFLSTPTSNDNIVAIPTPIPGSLPQNPISPLIQPLPSHSLSPFPIKVEEDANLGPSFDQDTVKIKEEGFVETPSKEGEDEMGQNEICELEVKKESVDIGEDLRAIKEEEATLSIREELPQPIQQSNSHTELSPTRIEPQATLASSVSGIQVEDESEVGEHLEVRRQEVGIAGGEVTNNSNEEAVPSSDLSEVDEEAIAESGSENSAAESITEVLAKRKARRESSTCESSSFSIMRGLIGSG